MAKIKGSNSFRRILSNGKVNNLKKGDKNGSTAEARKDEYQKIADFFAYIVAFYDHHDKYEQAY